MARRRGPYIDSDILAEIQRQAFDGWRASQIHEDLKRQEAFAKRLPSKRTVQRIVASVISDDISGTWSLADSNEDVELVLPVLGAVIEATEGRRQHLTRTEAEVIARIRRVAPDLAPTAELLWLARAYMVRTEQKEATADLDAFLAFAPWRPGKPRQRYFEALRWGWARQSPFLEMIRARIVELAVRAEEAEEMGRLTRELQSGGEGNTNVGQTRQQ